MNYNYNENYQYDSCISHGICSVNPKTSSLLEILGLYLKTAAHYAVRLHENGIDDEDTKYTILNTISIIVSNPEFSENDFRVIALKFNNILPKLIKQYEISCKDKGICPEHIKTPIKFNKKFDLIKSIQLGEKEFLKKTRRISIEIRNLYTVLFIIAKSICINILDLESLDIVDMEGYITVLRLLDSINTEGQDVEKIKSLIQEASICDYRLMKTVRNTQEEIYGKQTTADVSYSTTAGKAILVVGSNVKELEKILDAVKDTEIDVYTHDDMMLANTFPKFRTYKNLKGQYGQGIENCLLDFSTFPGPIILTRHSLYNVEHLYRGQLYTTDFAYSKGVIPISDENYSPVIEAALNSRGFKTGKQCETVKIGYNYEEIIDGIKNKLSGNKFSNLIIVGLGGYTLEQKTYFDKFFKQVPNETLVVSLYYSSENTNILHVNACFDSFAILKIIEGIQNFSNINITAIFPKCDRHTLSEIMYLTTKANINIYIGKCTPIILNPNFIQTIGKYFGIHGITSVKKDLAEILAKK